METFKETTNKKNDLLIYQKYLELIYYSNDLLRKYPKLENFALVKEVKDSLYSGLKFLMYAVKMYNKKDKLKYLNEFDVALSMLKVQIRLSFKYKYITVKNYETWSNYISNICNMLGAWILSCQKK